MTDLYKRIDDECSLPPEMLTLIMSGKAKLWEFDEKYSAEDVYTLLEIMDISTSLEEQRNKEEEAKRKREARKT